MSSFSTWIVAGGVLIALPFAYRTGLQVYDDLYQRFLSWKHDRLTLEHIEKQNELQTIRVIPPNEQARLGVAFDGTHFRDLDSRGIYTMVKIELFDPINERLDRMERLLIAGGRREIAQELLPISQESVMPQLPSRIPLSGLLDGAPTFRDVILGVSLDENGQTQVVRSDMAKLVHIAVGGSSGWGKSVFLRSLAFQLAKSSDPVDLVMVDLEGATLAPFSECSRLLYPVADTEKDTAYILRELGGELDKRKELFSAFPGVDSLYTYNTRADEPLRPIVSIIDEATALLENKTIEGKIRTLALRARKYGLWMVLAGQDWKASSLDTAIRNQLSTRIQFRAMSGGQSRVLLERSDAEALNVPGRAFGWFPGRDLLEFQAPVLGYEDILAAMSGGPQREIGSELSEDDQIMEFHRQGMSNRQIALALYGYTNGVVAKRIAETVAQNATV